MQILILLVGLVINANISCFLKLENLHSQNRYEFKRGVLE
jgi:hypothetical protein